MPGPHVQKEDWFLMVEQSAIPGGRGA
eukprot:COSAG04_NODE_14994_length_547_cov_1.158482_1_plen_26_part_01